MPFRSDLDLSQIADKYEVFNPDFHSVKARYGPAPEEVPEYAWEPAPLAGTSEDPALVGSGPRRCSTRRTVASRGQQWAWDPNRYYRDLGITWPYVHATKRDLRLAFLAVDGERSVRLTYCLKQLLSPAVRQAYDALPLGEQYLDDIYVQEALKKKAALEASARSETGNYTTAEEMLDQWGYRLIPPSAETAVETVDEDHLKRQDVNPHPEIVGAEWEYSFYLWKTTKWDYTRLSAWQTALIAELDQRGLSPTLTVGLMGKKPHPYAIGFVDNEWVVFLNVESEVSPDLASAAASTLHKEISAQHHAPNEESR